MRERLLVFHTELHGVIYVDAGMCMVGDPSGFIGPDSKGAQISWQNFRDGLSGWDGKAPQEPLGERLGINISTPGDGIYPVYVTHVTDEKGEEQVASLTVRFRDESGRYYGIKEAEEDFDNEMAEIEKTSDE